MQHSAHQQSPSDDDDRRSRFHSPGAENGSGSLRERAASQPPRSSDQPFVSSPSQQHFVPSSLGGNRSPWLNQQRTPLGSNRVGTSGQPVPIRSSSFSAQSQGQFSSTMRERAFPSTFEDDESEGLSDTYDERYVPPSLSRGRTYGMESRSRSQSLATIPRPGPVGSPSQLGGGASAMQSWNESYLSNPLNIPGRFGDIKPPGSSRYGSLGTLGRSPTNLRSSPTSGSALGNGYSNRQTVDVSNMSPFVRDVGQILLDDGSAFRELWGTGMNPLREENGGGGSGTTSRRHSVSVVQPRRGNVVGFNVPGGDGLDEPSRPVFTQSFGGRGGLMLSDDDLASDLGLLNIGPSDSSSSSQHPPSQPASLPIYAPLSRSPPSRDLISPYQSINTLSIPGGNSYSRHLGTPSDNGLSAGGTSPSRSSAFDQTFGESQYNNGSSGRQSQGQGQQPELTARFIPGQGIQYLPPQNHNQSQGTQYTRTRAPSYSNTLPSPISPSGTRAINPQQQPFYPQQMHRRPSDAGQQPLSELGKGVPLHAVPASWPLFIVEFKAGRTDLFYLTDLSQDIRVGDLVIVEADRGKDLGKVVNDSITLAEVEAFQKQQQDRAGFGDGQPTSPGGSVSTGKKEINPKMIYGKAQSHDAQLLVSKMQDELKALQLCQSKVRAKKLPMEVVDAEYQWDRRKLTFYFIAEKRIDFRELVRELFRLYKTRIWMASLQGGGSFEQ